MRSGSSPCKEFVNGAFGRVRGPSAFLVMQKACLVSKKGLPSVPHLGFHLAEEDERFCPLLVRSTRLSGWKHVTVCTVRAVRCWNRLTMKEWSRERSVCWLHMLRTEFTQVSRARLVAQGGRPAGCGEKPPLSGLSWEKECRARKQTWCATDKRHRGLSLGMGRVLKRNPLHLVQTKSGIFDVNGC